MLIIKPKKTLKVCHVTSVHNRYDVRILYKECKSLAKYGFDVTLLVNDNLRDEFIDDVKIKSTYYKPKNRYERMVISQRRLKKEAIKIDADIYHFHDPELLLLALHLKNKGKKIIFDFHEDVSQQILYKKWIPNSIKKTISEIYKFYEKNKVKEFDALITVTPKFVERLQSINPNTYMITNYPILRDIYPRNDEFISNTICFAGGITPQWNHHHIIKAIEDIDNINYLIAGSGSRKYLQCLMQLQGWQKAKYMGRIPHEEVKYIYNKSFAGITLLSKQSQVGDEGTLGNTKIFEYMEAGLPVICSDNKIWGEIVNTYECGIAVDPENVDKIRTAILTLLNSPKMVLEMGRNGRMAVEKNFNWQTQEKVLYSIYNSVLDD